MGVFNIVKESIQKRINLTGKIGVMRRLLIGNFLISLAMGAVALLLPIYAAKELGASYTEIGLIGTMYVIFDVIFSVPAGVLGDRFGRRRFIVLGYVMTSFSFYLYTFCSSVTQLLLVRLYQGLAEAPVWVNMQTAIAELSGEHERGRAMGLYGTSWAAAFGVGPIFAGWAYPEFGARWVFLWSAALAICSVIPVLMTEFKPPRRVLKRPDFVRLLPLCFATLIYIGVVAIFHTLLPAYAVVDLGLTEFEASTLITVFTIVRGVVFAPLGGLSDRFGAKRMIVASIGASAFISLGLALATTYSVLLLFSLLLAVAEGAVYPAVVSTISKLGERSSPGLVLGIFNSVGMAGWGIFPGVGGVIADRCGPSAPFLMFVVVGLVSLPFLQKVLRE